MKTIKINGTVRNVLNSYSSGPGTPVNAYDVKGGYVYAVGAEWKLSTPGQFTVTVKVEA